MFVKTPARHRTPRRTPHRNVAGVSTVGGYSRTAPRTGGRNTTFSRNVDGGRTPVQSAMLRNDGRARRSVLHSHSLSLSKRPRVVEQVRRLHSDASSSIEIRALFPRLLTDALSDAGISMLSSTNPNISSSDQVSNSSDFAEKMGRPFESQLLFSKDSRNLPAIFGDVSPSGWTYAVVGGRIYVWDSSAAVDCEVGSMLYHPDCYVRDFPAPSVPIVSPSLITLFSSLSSHSSLTSIGLFAISRTGCIRCWPELSPNSTCVELLLPLQQENINEAEKRFEQEENSAPTVIAVKALAAGVTSHNSKARQCFVCCCSNGVLYLVTFSESLNKSGFELQYEVMVSPESKFEWAGKAVERMVGERVSGIIGGALGVLGFGNTGRTGRTNNQNEQNQSLRNTKSSSTCEVSALVTTRFRNSDVSYILSHRISSTNNFNNSLKSSNTWLQRWEIQQDTNNGKKGCTSSKLTWDWPLGKNIQARLENSYNYGNEKNTLEVKILDILSLGGVYGDGSSLFALCIAHPKVQNGDLSVVAESRYSIHCIDVRGHQPDLQSFITLDFKLPSRDWFQNDANAMKCLHSARLVSGGINTHDKTAFVWWPQLMNANSGALTGKAVAIKMPSIQSNNTQNIEQSSSLEITLPKCAVGAGFITGGTGLYVLCPGLGLLRFNAKIHKVSNEGINGSSNVFSLASDYNTVVPSVEDDPRLCDIKRILIDTVKVAAEHRKYHEQQCDGVLSSRPLPQNILMQLMSIARQALKDTQIQSILCAAVQTISSAILDEIADPGRNWQDYDEETENTDGKSVISSKIPRLVQYQLQHKQNLHSDLLSILRSGTLWRSVDTNTRSLLARHGALLHGTNSLYRFQHDTITCGKQRLCTQTLIEAMEDTCRRRGVLSDQEMRRTGLTVQDIFYANVSTLPDVLGPLLHAENNMLLAIARGAPRQQQTGHVPMDRYVLVQYVNDVFSCVLLETASHRSRTSGRYFDGNFEHLSSVSGLVCGSVPLLVGETRECLQHQLDCNVSLLNDINSMNGNLSLKDQQSKLLEQFASLGGLLLSSFREEEENELKANGGDNVAKTSHNEQYLRWKKRIIDPIEAVANVDKHGRGFLEIAVHLAEEHRYLDLLVRLFWRDADRMQVYANRFPGFSNFAYQWLLDSRSTSGGDGKFVVLLEQPQSQHNSLSKFLSAHPRLSWVHYLRTQSFGDAAKNLLAVAMEERQSIRAKKTMLSIAKLSVLATRNDDNTNNISPEDDSMLVVSSDIAQQRAQENSLLNTIDAHINLADSQIHLIPNDESETSYSTCVNGVDEVASSAVNIFWSYIQKVDVLGRAGANLEELWKPLQYALIVVEAATVAGEWGTEENAIEISNACHAALWRCISRVDGSRWATWLEQRNLSTISDSQLEDLFMQTLLFRAAFSFKGNDVRLRLNFLLEDENVESYIQSADALGLSAGLLSPFNATEANFIMIAGEAAFATIS